MAFLPAIADVQAIAVDDAFIQGLTGTETVWTNMTIYGAKIITEAIYGELQFEAQTYWAAHILSSANQPIGGKGPLSSESVGGINVSHTLPWLNQTLQLGGTQFGLHYLQIRDMVAFPFAVVTI